MWWIGHVVWDMLKFTAEVPVASRTDGPAGFRASAGRQPGAAAV